MRLNKLENIRYETNLQNFGHNTRNTEHFFKYIS